MAVAVFGAGCFWCVEAVFTQLNGVESVEPGYTGGETKDPTYKQVCTGTTGHAEVCRITYDPQTISFAKLLEVFWQTHDPTTLNRQGNDVGTQYRSSIFFHDEEQKQQSIGIKATWWVCRSTGPPVCRRQRQVFPAPNGDHRTK